MVDIEFTKASDDEKAEVQLEEDIKAAKAELNKLKTEKESQIAELEKQLSLKKFTAKLDKITKVRAALAAVYKEHGVTPAEVKAYPISYKFRNGRNRSNDETAEWIKTFISKGGTLADLENNARQHDLTELGKLSKKGSRKKKDTNKTTSNDFKAKEASSGKGAA